MTELAPSLIELARRYGIATDYEDWTGRRVRVPETTLTAVLAALGVAAGTEQETQRRADRQAARVLGAPVARDHRRADR
ncbi:hypothetical protein O981_13795 [Mycobacterium avium 10-5560]|nr:hypothetical protein O981_13795 [Mycobacterium avium 10-5560]